MIYYYIEQSERSENPPGLTDRVISDEYQHGARSGARVKWQELMTENNHDFTLSDTVLMMACRVVTTWVSSRL
jgi:hypothetical protein